jgi:predicted amidohydrolase YtcJ
MFGEKRLGSLGVGKQADIAGWDRDLYSVHADELRDLRCEMTSCAGQLVYSRE